MRKILLLTFALLSFLVKAQEGTKQLMPNETDKLQIRVPDTNDTESRIYIYLRAGEKMYLGMNPTSGSTNYQLNDPSDNIVIPSTPMPTSGAGYISTYQEAISGPEGVYLNGVQTSTADGYTPIVYTATTTGNHYISFGSQIYLDYFDITVTDTSGNIIVNPDQPNKSAGRVWSYKWNFNTTSFTQYPVNADFYVFTSDEFVNKVKYKMYPYIFSFAVNSYGIDDTKSNPIEKAQSYNGNKSNTGEYKIFLNDPDHEAFTGTSLPPPMLKVWLEDTKIYDYDYDREPQLLNINAGTVTLEKNGAACTYGSKTLFKIETNISGFTTILLDLNNDGVYTSGSVDRYLNVDLNVGTNYVIWDFKDDSGNAVSDGVISASATFLGRGPAHFPIYDAEALSGIETASIRPFNKLGPTLYWDDSKISAVGEWGDNTGKMDETVVTQLKINAGIERIWTYYGNNGNFQNGNGNTMNSWFNAIDLGMPSIPINISTNASKCENGNAPIIADIYKETPINASLTFSASDFENKFFDISQSLNKIQILSLPDPAHGVLRLSGVDVAVNDEILQSDISNLIFIPTTDWGGETTFEYNASNGTYYADDSDFVYIKVNTDPVISDIEDQSICANTELINLPFTVNDAETDVDDIEVIAYSHNTDIVSNKKITVGGSGSNRTISITPNTDTAGSAIVYVKADDGYSEVIKSFTLYIGPSIEVMGDTTICSGNDLNLSAEEPGATYLWTDPNGATYVTQDLNIASGSVSYGTYSLTVSKGGCVHSNDFEVSQSPLVSFTGETSACAGDDITLSAKETVATSYTWTNGSLTYNTKILNDDVSTLVSSNWTLKITKEGCTNTSAPFEILANNAPAVKTTTGSTVEAGENGVVTIISSESNIVYKAYIKGTEVGSNIGDGNDISINILPSRLLIGANTVELIASEGGCETTLSNVTITVNQPKISINDVSVNEGNTGTKNMQFVVSLSYYSQSDITVDYSTHDNSATVADVDYQSLTSGTITFESGETSKTINVTVNGDKKAELDEALYLNLTNAVNAVIDDAQGVGTISNDDNAPVLIASDKSVSEGTTAVETVSATDADAGDSKTFSISGTDASFFSIGSSTGVLTFASAPDYENAADADKNNIYILDVTVTDGGSNTDTKTINVTVTDVNDNSPILSASDKSVSEGTTAVETVSATDVDAGDSKTFSISGTDASFFSIDSSTGVLTFASAPDYENAADADKNNIYVLDVTVTDGGSNTDTKTINVTVTDVNDNSPIVSASDKSVSEGTTAVETVSATDADAGDSKTFSISGTDASFFSIGVSSGVLTFASAPDYEKAVDADKNNIYVLDVTVTDGSSHTDTKTINVTVTDVNDNSPELSASDKSVSEGTTAVETVSATDADAGDSKTYSISGTDASFFSIGSSTGVLTFASAPDYENAVDADKNNIYVLDVTVTDGSSHTDTKTINVTVTDVNDNSPILSASDKSISEGTTAVETVSATDVDAGDSKTYSISGTDASFFSIDSSTGVLTFASAPDYENAADADKNNIYVLDVTVTDGSSHTDTKTINVTVTDVNDNSPILSASDKSISEGTTAVETVSATDVDAGDSKTYSISGTDASFFSIDSSTGVLTFASAPDYENAADADKNNIYVLDVTVTDGSSHTDTKTINVTVTDVNDNSPILSASDKSVSEGTTAVETVSATDADAGDSKTFSISGTDASFFSIGESSGVLTFASAPDYENAADADKNNIYVLDVTVTDGSSHTDTKTINVTVTDVNDNSPELSASDKSVSEGTTAVETVSATDADAGDSKTFSISGTDASFFSIDSSTGVLTFASAPDYENAADADKNNIYVLDVTVTDGSSHTDTKTIYVTVTDVNDNSPILSASDKSVSEGTTAVETVSATDADAGDSKTFSISGTDASYFSIDSSTGVLTFASAPDYENAADADKNNVYVLDVTVTDGGSNTDTKTINVTVTDVNDNSPILSASDKSVSEGTTAVETVSATDADAGDSKIFSVSGTDASFFSIDSSTGVLTFASAPDYENAADADKNNIYVLDVTVTDGSSHTDTKTINVTVTDVNDNSPILSASDKSVSEGTTAVETVSATDADAGDSKTFSISGTDASFFSIGSSTGVLTFASAPDYENAADADKNNIYILDVTVTDGGSNTDTKTINVTVTDVNDNSPILSASDKSVSEGTTAVETVSATDADAGDSKTFSISGTDASYFSIDSSTGVLTFASAPDYENAADADKNNVYVLDVTVTDGGSNTDTKTINVTVTDVNDNSPILSASDKSVSEGTTAVETVSATDADAGDSKIFSVSGTDASFFSIDSSTGVLTFASAPDYENVADADKNNIYVLDVTVTDGSSHTDTKTINVTVTDVNDNSPILSASDKSVSEGTTAVETVSATDADAGDSKTFSISGTDASFFSIGSSTGVLTFASAPDYENAADADKNNIYILDVTVTDGGSNTDTKTINVTVTDVNDNSPILSASDKSVSEGTTAVETVSATDVDAGDSKTFSISGTDASFFSIDSSTGVLTFASAPDYENAADADKNNIYVLDVTVTDGGSNTDTKTINVTVTDVNDNSPIVSASDKSVSEGTTAVETVSATDADAGDSKTFSISGTDASFFSIGVSSGVLTFASAPDYEKAVDADKNNIYVLDVTVTDGSSHTDTKTINVTVTDVNDNSPELSASDKSVSEGTTAVETVSATDADAGDSKTYSISGTDASFFSIGSSTGVLTFASAPDYENAVDADKNNIYVLDVTVTDGSSHTDTKTINVTVTDVNDNSPILSASDKSISEGTTAVETVSATDVDAGDSKTYSISGTDASFFSIDSSTGVLTFASAPDYENAADADKNNIYVLDVTVTDGSSHTDTKTINVTVTDVNDNSPILSASDKSISEGTTAVETVSATDVDAGDSKTYSISGTDASFFSIDSSTGVLTFASAPDYENAADADKNNIYVLDVTVTDGSSHTDTKTINVTVTDVNDNSPILSASDKSVSEGTTAVETVSATDADAGDSKTFSISGTDASFFSIGESSGVLTFASAPDYENAADADKNNIYVLDVTVTDGSSHTDTKTINVTVTDVNDNSPELSASDKSVSEGTTAVETVSATDADAGDSKTFSISGTDASFFSIDSSTGVLTFASAPDYENAADADKNNIYVLDVTVTDGSSHTDTKTINVTVTDVNDNSPELSASDKSVSEGTTAVETVSATDADAGDSKTFSISGTDASFFSIDSSTGVLTFASAPDYENAADADKNNIYVLDVTVTDGSSHTDTKTINVMVTDVNDNSPILSASDKSVSEGTTAVETVSATDVDAGDSKTFSISGTDASFFSIDSSTGVLTFASAPDYENAADADKNNIYVLDVTVTDGSSHTDTKTINVTVTDVNDNSPELSASDKSVSEGTTAVETVSATDADAGDSKTFSISGTDASFFSIGSSTGVLTFASAPDYENAADADKNNIYVLDVTVTDGSSHTDTKTINVTVTDVNDNSPELSASDKSVSEGTTAVETVSATDADAGDSKTFSISGTDASFFSIGSSTGVLTFASAPDYENAADADKNNIYVLDVTVTDGSSHTDTKTINVTVTDVNDNSPILSASDKSVSEGTTAVETVSATDADAGDSKTFSISGTDASFFSIGESSGVLTFASAPDYENAADADKNNIYVLDVTVTDGSSHTDMKTINVTVTDVNDNDPVINVSNTTVPENYIGVVIDASSSDLDVNDIETYSLSGDDATLFNINASTGELTFKVAPDYENPSDSNTDNVYELTIIVSDGAGNRDSEAIIVTVTNENDSLPVAFADEVDSDKGAVSIIDVLSNDTGLEDGNLVVSIPVQPADGVVIVNEDNTITITPNDDFVGDITFNYQVCDGEGDCSISTVTVTVEETDNDGDGILNIDEGDGDTDRDGILDKNDPDSDNDRILDAEEGTGDADGDGIPNYKDSDSDGDGIPDVEEGSDDIDGDGVGNYLDLDSDGDGIPDSEEGNMDSDSDGTPDYKDTDSDNDGILDSVEGTDDKDGDGIPNYKDSDSDGDGISDAEEGFDDIDGDGDGNYLDLDSDDDGIPDSEEGNVDSDNDGTADYQDTDSDNDGILDSVEGSFDSDNDGTPDYTDTDSDGDGIPDVVEGSDDVDNDGDGNYLDLDSDDDGIPDSEEGNIDSDNDGTPDYQDTDSDNDGTLDSEESTGDCDNDGVPDRIDEDKCYGEDELILYEGFSPNNDGDNDTYNIPWLYQFNQVSIEIFNRWGNVVYKQTKYDNNWNGESNVGFSVGKELPVGTYYYIIYVRDIDRKITGYIYLNR